MPEYGSLAWTAVGDSDGWVGLLPVGAVEAHGPHLPLATDGWIAEAMAARAAEQLQRAGTVARILPTHNYTAAGFARRFAGTIDTPPSATEAVISAAAGAVESGGGSLLVIVNAHFDPANVAAIQAAVSASRADPDACQVLYFDLTRRRHAERIGGEFATGACHAGRYEGSLMLAIRPDLVNQELASSLAPHPRSLAEAIRDGASSFDELGGDQAYFGWPAEATAAEGNETLDRIGQMLTEEVIAALTPALEDDS